MIFNSPENLITALYLIGVMDMDDDLTFTLMNRKYLEKWLDETAQRIKYAFITKGFSDDAVEDVYDILKTTVTNIFKPFEELNSILEIRKEYIEEIDEFYIMRLESEVSLSKSPKGILVVYKRGIFYMDTNNIGQRGKKLLYLETSVESNKDKFDKTVLIDLLKRIQKLIKMKMGKVT